MVQHICKATDSKAWGILDTHVGCARGSPIGQGVARSLGSSEETQHPRMEPGEGMVSMAWMARATEEVIGAK